MSTQKQVGTFIIMLLMVCCLPIATVSAQANLQQTPPLRPVQQQQQQQQQQMRQQQQTYGGAANPDSDFRAAVQNLVNSYRGRGVSNSLLQSVENAVNQGGGGGQNLAPQVRIRNIDSFGQVSIYYDLYGAPAETIGPGQTSSVINIGYGPVYLQAYKVDQFGNSRVLDVHVEQVNNSPARFWDGDDFRFFTLQTGNLFPRGLNNQARLERYRIER